MSEWDVFPEAFDPADTQYLAVLQRIINNQIRAQRQPFCELRILTEGDPESEAIMRSMLINDQICNPVYNLDFTKFLATITGSGSSGPAGPGAIAGAVPGSTTGGYY